MKAFQVSQIGRPPELVEVATPAPGPGEVRIRIHACGLNFADLLMIKGEYQEKPPLPFAVGMEVAGTVEALGAGVTVPVVGTRVAVIAGYGGLAEYGVYAADRCTPVPDSMPFETAAAFQIAYGTSHVALVHRAGLRAGETVLVLGAAGGVGLTAVEIAHGLGARVIACARGAERLEIAREAGADVLLDTDREDFAAALKDAGGADVVYDAVGGALFKSALRACRTGGRYLVIGFAAGEVPQIPANYLLVKNITVHGVYFGGYLVLDPEVVTDSLATLFQLYAEGRLAPHISHALPLAQAAEGLELLRSRKSTGKVVITM